MQSDTGELITLVRKGLREKQGKILNIHQYCNSIFKSVQNLKKKSQEVDYTERSEESRGGIIHPVKNKNKKEKNSLLQSEQEQRSKT